MKDFSFATRGEVKLSVNYDAPGFKTLIEVYRENPIVEGSNNKKIGLQPIYSAYTDNNGKLDGIMYIPSAINEAYLYTNRWGLPLSVKLDVNSEALTMVYDATKHDLKSSRAMTKAPYDYVVGTTPPYVLLGRSDNLFALGRFDRSGYVFYKGSGLPSDYTTNYIKNTTTIKGESIADLSKRTQQFYEKYEGKRVDLLTSAEKTNLRVKKEGSLDFIFLAEYAEYKNTIGYYYYEAGSAPKEADFLRMKKYVILPTVEGDGRAVRTRSTIRLQYFGKNGDEVASDKFPENTVVGWFIVSDGWSTFSDRIKPWDSYERNFFFSNDQDKNMRFVSLVDSKTGTVVLGCEDQPEWHFDRVKEDYQDMLFFIKSDDGEFDNEGKPDISEETPETPDGEFPIEGVISFEDIWPSGGDYDMNDVALTYSRSIIFDKDNNTTSVEENFKFIQEKGAASIDSYFAYQVENMGTVVLPVGCEMEAATNSIVFVNSTRVSSGEAFTVKRTFQGAVKIDVIVNDFNPYIMIGSKDKRKEVHLPSHKATVKADKSFIGTGNDAYYMDKNGSYPFAIDIPKVDFKLSREARSIDKTYPRFATWATSFGKKDADWYNDAPKN